MALVAPDSSVRSSVAAKHDDEDVGAAAGAAPEPDEDEAVVQTAGRGVPNPVPGWHTEFS
jgi:hypothetical protein